VLPGRHPAGRVFLRIAPNDSKGLVQVRILAPQPLFFLPLAARSTKQGGRTPWRTMNRILLIDLSQRELQERIKLKSRRDVAALALQSARAGTALAGAAGMR
jgi:hypothetical protein